MAEVKRIDGQFKRWLEGVCNKDQHFRLKEKGDFYQAVWIYDEKIDALCSSYGMTIYVSFLGGFSVNGNELSLYELDDNGKPTPDEDSPFMTFVPVEITECEFSRGWNETFGY